MRKRKLGKAVSNERIKLAAAFFNNIGAGVIIAAAIVPCFAFAMRDANLTSSEVHIVLLVMASAIVFGGMFHYLGSTVLKELSE